MVTLEEQVTIRAYYDRIVALGCKAHNLDLDSTRHAFSRPTYHFGRWKRQGNPPLITRDTLQSDTTDLNLRVEQQKAIFTLIALVGQILFSRVRPKLNQYDRDVQLRMSQGASMAAEVTENNFRILPQALDQAVQVSRNPFPLRFGGIATSMAATTGQGDQLHLDMDDGDYTVVLPMCHIHGGGYGDWALPLDQQWGQLELPQLGYRIPVRPGQALLFRANHLLHAATPLPVEVMDDRLSLTVFNCTYLQRTAIGAWQNPWTRSMARARAAVRSVARAIRGG